LMEIIEARNWYPLRKKMGTEYALAELMDQTDVQVSRNFFLYEDESNAPRSARIDITVVDVDAQQAYAVADAVANVIVSSTQEKRQAAAAGVANEVKAVQAAFNDRIAKLQRRNIELAAAIGNAERIQDLSALAHLRVEKLNIGDEVKRLREQMTASALAGTLESLSEQISAAGQEVEVSRVREDRPSPNPARGMLLVASTIVVFLMLVVVVAILLGAFDTRIHDADDLRRLGLPIIGHFPAFPGDHVGALKSRGALTSSTAGRVPLWRLWR
jgi:capsular polysaccharide biosynthesis protein